MLQPMKKIPKTCFPIRIQANKRRDVVVFITNESNYNILHIFNPLAKDIKKITIDKNLNLPIKYEWLDDTNSILLVFNNNGKQQVFIFDIDTKYRTILKIDDLDNNSPLCFNSNYTEICYISQIKQRKYLTIYNLLTDIKLRLKDLRQCRLESIFWSKNNGIFYSLNLPNSEISRIECVNTKDMKISCPLMFTKSGDSSLIGISNDGTYLLCRTTINGINRTCVYDILSKEMIQFGDGCFNEFPVNFSYDERNILAIREYQDKKIPIMYTFDSKAEQILPFDGSSNDDMQFCLDDEFIIFSKQIHSSAFIISLYDLVDNSIETILNVGQN